MKKLLLGSLLFLCCTILVNAQEESANTQEKYVIYTFFFNSVPDRSPIPLIGFGNFARGNYNGAQIGFVNMTSKNFNGAKFGFVNTIGGDFKGANFGFINTTIGRSKGANFSFMNITKKDFHGANFGFMNTTKDSLKGANFGFINTAGGNTTGANFGFVNFAGGNFSGANVGFVNVVKGDNKGLDINFVSVTKGDFKGTNIGFVNVNSQNTKGFQLGFVNSTRKHMKGTQIGFVNFADSISNGVPIGFLSIVKKGGYRALEISLSELYVVNLAFKIGVPYFYSFIQGSYHYQYNKPFALGAGFGSLIPIAKRFYFNPEIGTISSINNNSKMTTTLAANIRYSISSRFQVAAGLSAVWLNDMTKNEDNLYDPPFFALVNQKIDANNRILLGARVAVSFNFTKL